MTRVTPFLLLLLVFNTFIDQLVLLEKMFEFDNFETVLTSEFRNFATQIARGSLENYFDDDIDQVAGFIGWRLVLLLGEDAGGAYIVPTFNRPLSSYYKILNVRILINPVNHLKSKNDKFKYADQFYFDMDSSIEGKKMYLSELLDEKNGWLTGGAFTIRIGFYADSLMDKYGIWRFNFLNDPFELKSPSDVVYLYRESTDLRVMCHIQLLKLHCKNLNEQMNAENEIHGIPNFDEMKFCLDILHGVHLKFSNDIYARILKIAKFLEFSNVIRYIELQFIEDPRGYKEIGSWISFAIQWNFYRLLIRLLEKLENLCVLAEVMKKVDIEKMSGETMKICMKKLLYDFE